MYSRLSRFLQLALLLGNAFAASAVAQTATLDDATVIGYTNNSVTSFMGIPFAEPPLGDLRLRLPKPITSYSGTINATQPATQCIQLPLPIRTDLPPELLQDMIAYLEVLESGAGLPQSEDCLTVNIQVPEGTLPGDKLPVIAFIFGGGFAIGSTAQMPGDGIVQRSVAMGQPVIFAAMNYRLHAFGFLGGKEVKEAGVGNLGLHDQREGLRWIHTHIAAFGGDPDRVTIWGPSAGAISVGLQMVTNGGDTEGLFRGAIMSSGSPLPSGDITNLQLTYDTIVEHAGCANSSDTLECLRQVPADTLLAAAETLPSLFGYPGLATPWAPRADGVFLEDAPQHLVLSGSVADVPFITGDSLDEGTVFASGSFNVTTEDAFRAYVEQFFFSGVPEASLAPLFELYPNDPAQGSPFGTGDDNQLAPMYKRMAAFQGDMIFQAPRRFILDHRSSQQDTWTFINERGRSGGLGVAHGSDFGAALSGADDLADYIIQFTATRDPNGASNRTIPWPKYDTVNRQALHVVEEGLNIGNDTLRLAAMGGLTALSIAFPL
ncbi:alpha/beta-hydrolase [Polyporus arcularius HHB13444]|uniref:Carboxylic ester hydrolase n=1 Tax=Polyporus arcularius HHB13444 TaxID=1314778 RepID=A0A5C3P1W9_9APHY|nr:alpha/beta-hydrolase [Polyporus arcularius HHB13444]